MTLFILIKRADKWNQALRWFTLQNRQETNRRKILATDEHRLTQIYLVGHDVLGKTAYDFNHQGKASLPLGKGA